MTTTNTATPSRTTIWQVDPAHTSIEFAVKHLMIATVRGRFSQFSGTVIVPGDDFSRARVDATIIVASIDTHQPDRDSHLKSPDFFDAGTHPTMTFMSRQVERRSDRPNHYRLVGDLTSMASRKRSRSTRASRG